MDTDEVSLKRPTSAAALCAFAASLFTCAAMAQYVPTELYQYPGTSNNTTGLSTYTSMAQGPDGDIYLTDTLNGKYGAGSVFKFSTAGVPATVYSFCAEGGGCAATGSIPQGGVILGGDGNFYGTTQDGGTYGEGTVFKVTPKGVYTMLHSFHETVQSNGQSDEGAPFYPLVEGLNGSFYGVDFGLYNTDYGVFYQITAKGVLTPHDFDFTDGAVPNLPVQTGNGDFYGTTRGGGANRTGVVYRATTGGKITVLYNFPANEGEPVGQLVEGPDGNFWGVVAAGGASSGEIFKVSPKGVLTVVHTFGTSGDGTNPVVGLVLGSDQNFYGTTVSGGSQGVGTIFRINTAGTYQLVYSFCSTAGCPTGFYPVTVLLQHTNGTFYGSTGGNSLGGSYFYSLNVGAPPFIRTRSQSGKVGAKVYFFGQNFTGTTAVNFNGTAATFDLMSATEVSAVVPADAITGPVSVVTGSGTFNAITDFAILPTATSFSPTSGAVGTAVTITGTGFTGATSVKIGGESASFMVVSSTTVTAVVPAGAKDGLVTVATAGGSANAPGTFTVTP